MTRFPFIGGSYPARSRHFDLQRSINLYPEFSQSGTSRTEGMLIGTPGTRRVASVGDGPIRGLLPVTPDTLLVASGPMLFRLAPDWSATEVGEISGAGAVSMASNGLAAMIVCGEQAYFLPFDSWTLRQADAGVFRGADRVAFLDGRFVWNQRGTGQFMWTAPYAQTLDALNFASAEGAPDAIVSLLVDHRELWLFGATSTEVWTSTGDSHQPFARINGAFLEHGCAAAHSVAKLDNSVFWLGADERGQGIVWRADGYTPLRISTHALEYVLAGLPRLDDAVAWTYQQEGHSFYVLSLPGADITWVYDAATQLWHERAWRDPENGALRPHRGQCQAAFGGQILVGDREDGRVYALDLDHYTDDDALIARIRVAPHLADAGRRLTIAELQVDFETGVGQVAGPGSDPKAVLEISKDYGHTWGHAHGARLDRAAALGKTGERRTRVVWRRLGQARDFVFRITVTDPVPVRMLGASVRLG